MTTKQQKLAPSAFEDMQRKYIVLVVPQGQRATLGNDTPRMMVLNLENANAGNFDTWLEEAVKATLLSSDARRTIYEQVDRQHWPALDKWWAIHEARKLGVKLTLYSSAAEANAAIAQSLQLLATVDALFDAAESREEAVEA